MANTIVIPAAKPAIFRHNIEELLRFGNRVI